METVEVYKLVKCKKFIPVQTVLGTNRQSLGEGVGVGKSDASSILAETNVSPDVLCRMINGEIYQASAILGRIRTSLLTDASLSRFDDELKRWQQILFQSGGDLYRMTDFHIGEEQLSFLNNWAHQLEKEVHRPEGFVLPGGHPLNPLFHQLSAVVTQGERWFVIACTRTPLSHGVRSVLYMSSRIAFLLSIYVNEINGYDHEYVY